MISTLYRIQFDDSKYMIYRLGSKISKYSQNNIFHELIKVPLDMNLIYRKYL